MKKVVVIVIVLFVALCILACAAGDLYVVPNTMSAADVTATAQVESGIRLGAECTQTGKNCP